MGAPTAAPKKRAPRKKAGPTAKRADAALDAIDVDAQFSEADIAAMEADLDAKFAEAGPIGPDGEIRPVEVGKAGKAGSDLTHIFTLEGTKYYIPKKPPIAVMLRFMREVRDKRIGRYAAVEHAMISMLGKSKLDALCDNEDTSDDDVANVFIIVGHVLFTAIKNWRSKVDPALDPS